VTNNSLACRSGTVGSGVLGPLTVLEHVSAVTCQGSQCSFVEPAPERFLLATGVEYSPFGGWSLPIRLSVEVTLSQGLVVAENMTVVQTAKAGGTDALSTGRIIFGSTTSARRRQSITRLARPMPRCRAVPLPGDGHHQHDGANHPTHDLYTTHHRAGRTAHACLGVGHQSRQSPCPQWH